MIGLLLNIVIIVGLFLSIFWLIALLNTKNPSRKPKKYPSVTIIIPAFNEGENVSKTIKSCKELQYLGILNIIVVNDASTDNTLEHIKKFSGIKIIDKKKNEGKASALNTALKQVNTDYFSVVDADSTIKNDSLTNAIKYFYKSEDQEVGAVIAKMMPQNTNFNFAERIQLVEYMFVGLVRYLSAALRLLHVTPGVLSVYKTNLVKDLGGFDKNNLTEDFELAVRIRKKGYLINYAQDSVVFTKVPNQFNVFLKQRIRWARGFFRTIYKHKDILFNKKLGIFGMYEFPMNIISPLLFFIAVFILTFNIVKGIYEFLFKLIVTPEVIVWFEWSSFTERLLSFNTFVSIPILLSLFLVLIFLYLVFKFYNYSYLKEGKFKKILSLFIYIFIYNYIYIYVFSYAFYKEITGAKYSWGTKE